jgi:hypothetical protein
VEQCIAGCALQGETCSICLSSFHVGDDMRGLRVSAPQWPSTLLTLFSCCYAAHVGRLMVAVFVSPPSHVLQCPSARTRHFFHKACIDEWLGIRGCCPLCKYEILVDE